MSEEEVPTVDQQAQAGRIRQVEKLRDAGNGGLAPAVRTRLEELWEHGVDGVGQSPERIYIRSPFVIRERSGDPEPVLPRLIQSRGLQLRLELLMLFDAQCRHAPGEVAYNVRGITPRRDDRYVSWRDLTLATTAPTNGAGRGAGDLRTRQITEALRALEQQHLVQIPRDRGGNRRQYSKFRLLSEVGRPERHRYTVPEDVPVFALSRHFFTNLWVFALTDTELATFLALSWLRFTAPNRHNTEGVFLTAAAREKFFLLTRTTWRTTNLLHRLGLIDRMPDENRDFETGNIIGDFNEKWKRRQVPPVRFKVNQEVLEQPALEVIHRVLLYPTAEDKLRRLDPVERLAFA